MHSRGTGTDSSTTDTTLTVTIQMRSGLVNVYTLHSFDSYDDSVGSSGGSGADGNGGVTGGGDATNSTHPEGALEGSTGSTTATTSTTTAGTTTRSRSRRVVKKNFRCYYSGTIDPPFQYQQQPSSSSSSMGTSTTSGSSGTGTRTSRMVLFNHPSSNLARRNTAPNHPVHSNVLIASSDQCGIALYNVSIPYIAIGQRDNSDQTDPREPTNSTSSTATTTSTSAIASSDVWELSDDILMFRRKYANNCLLPHQVTNFDNTDNTDSSGSGSSGMAMRMITGVELYSLSHMTSSSGTSGVIAQPPSIAAPKKGRR